jgi:hypothetical protein
MLKSLADAVGSRLRLCEGTGREHAAEPGTGYQFLPVWVRFDDCRQVTFETGCLPGGIVALYLASEPNPWSGSVVFMLAKRVTRLPMMIRALGIGSDALAAERELFKAQISEEQ